METGILVTGLRKRKDWLQTELTTKSGVSLGMIGKYECGEAVPFVQAAK